MSQLFIVFCNIGDCLERAPYLYGGWGLPLYLAAISAKTWQVLNIFDATACEVPGSRL